MNACWLMSNSRRSKASCPCDDCGTPTFRLDRPDEYYMVTQDVWAEAGMDPDHIPDDDAWTGPDHHYLCIGCLEARLGRQLTAEDFTSVPVNTLAFGWKTGRLLDRLGLLERS